MSFRAAIAILAHQEEARIGGALQSLPLSDTAYEFHVVANGSTDRTADIARAHAAPGHNVHVHDWAEGGKSHSWNRFVYEVAPPRLPLVFLDGDAEFDEGTIPALLTGLSENPEWNLAAGVPRTGRRAAAYREEQRRSRGMFGDCYALSADFADRLRAANIRIPKGLVGDDSFVGSIAKTNLQGNWNWKLERTGVVDAAGFRSEVFNPRRPSNWMSQYRRMINYSVRHYELRAFVKMMDSERHPIFPAHANGLFDLYPEVLDERRSGLWRWFDSLARKRIAQRRAQDAN